MKKISIKLVSLAIEFNNRAKKKLSLVETANLLSLVLVDYKDKVFCNTTKG